MYCPTLTELPPPPPGKVGWPWTEGSSHLPDSMLDSLPWPKVSIVTPSYNQVQFIEETIRSVLLQGYPDLEYIIVDGGSTDGSVGIIRKYEPWLAYWKSKQDCGQSHAINKGWRQATGEILAWLNSDDTYEPGAVHIAAEFLVKHPEVDMVYGYCFLIDEDSKSIAPFWHNHCQFNIDQMIRNHHMCIPQQTVFIRKSILDQVGWLDKSLHFKMDRDLYIRIGLKGNVTKIRGHMASFRVHENAKSNFRNTIWARREFALIRKRYDGHLSLRTDLYFWKGFLWMLTKHTISKVPIVGDVLLTLYRGICHVFCRK